MEGEKDKKKEREVEEGKVTIEVKMVKHALKKST